MLHEDEAAEAEETAPETVTRTQFFSIEGRVDPVELVLCILNDTQPTGVGRLLEHRQFDSR